MKVLITGGAGFIGSHFVRDRLTRYPTDDVVTLDLLTYAGVRATVEELTDHPRHRFVHGDICDPEAVRLAMRGCELVVHFAAETHVDRSITNAAPFLRTNIEGTHTLLHVAHELGARFVHISTDEVYGPILEGAHTDASPLNPRSPYAASKAAADLLVRAHQETYGLQAVVVRPTNVFGPRQLPEKFIPLCITNALEDLPIPIYGDGQHRRGWLFVHDLCDAVNRVIHTGKTGEIYNVNSPWEFPNVVVAKTILRCLEKSESLLESVPDRPGHDRRYAMDASPLMRLGWRSTTTFEDGIRDTIAWYGGHPAWWQPLKARLREDPYHWLNRSVGTGARQAVRAAV